MNRVEFMAELSRLLEGIPEEDRLDALNYYNDYFDDAGSENEQKVIEELESPEKVAMKIRAERGDVEVVDSKKGDEEETRAEDTESGYQYYQESKEDKPWTSKILKYLLIAAIIVIGCPIIIPLAVALLAVVAAIVIAAFAIFAAIAIGFLAAVILGVVLFCTGIGSIFGTGVSIGLALIGLGLMAAAVGMVGTVAGVRLCIIVFPGIIRGIVYICRKPFHRRAEG